VTGNLVHRQEESKALGVADQFLQREDEGLFGVFDRNCAGFAFHALTHFSSFSRPLAASASLGRMILATVSAGALSADDDAAVGGITGWANRRPHCGHVDAASDTSRWQSGHLMSADVMTLPSRNPPAAFRAAGTSDIWAYANSALCTG
jgi:hypothetical protein